MFPYVVSRQPWKIHDAGPLGKVGGLPLASKGKLFSIVILRLGVVEHQKGL